MEFIKLAIVDDKQLNRVSLSERLNSAHIYEIVFTAENGEDFLDKMKHLPESNRPKVVLMDIDMPILNGIEAVRIASQIYSEVKFIMVTVFDDDDKIFEAIKAGASGYLLKDESSENIAESIRQVIDFGGAPMSPKVARKALNLLMKAELQLESTQKQDDILSNRELEILKIMVQGSNYKVIAEKLFISPHTVRKHIANIYEKLHVSNKVEAVKIALSKGWMASWFF